MSNRLSDEQKDQNHLNKFWASFNIAESGCWEWKTKGRDAYGYGMYSYPRKSTYAKPETGKAHRASFLIHFGYLPADLKVRHRCDNPACVNPEHLELGTQQDNLRDARERGRQDNSGARNGRSKLTEIQVREILKKSNTVDRKDLATAYGVSLGTFYDILDGRTWRRITKL